MIKLNMARWGRCDYSQLLRLQEKLENLQDIDIDSFCKKCAKELAARLLGKVIKRTPVGQYPSSTGKVGGTLRRGWTGGVDIDPRAYAKSLPISKVGNEYKVEIINFVEYSKYVEFGHRTPNHQGWVEGRFMLTISELELESQVEKIIEKKLVKFLGAYLNGK